MSKRLWVLTVLAAMLIVATSGAGFAASMLLGGTGVVTVPNALTAPMGGVQVAGSYQRLQDTSQVIALNLYGTDDSANAWSLQALAGVADSAELWAAYARDNGDFENKTWALGGKIGIPMQTKDVSVAIGGAYRHLKGSVTAFDSDPLVFANVELSQTIKDYDIFGVVTADLTAMGQSDWASGGRLLGSAGLMYKHGKGEFEEKLASDGSLVASSEGTESLTRPFLALEFLGAEGTDLGIEYRWSDDTLDAKAVFSAVIRHAFQEGWIAELGTTNADELGFGTEDQNWFVRVGYTFATGK